MSEYVEKEKSHNLATGFLRSVPPAPLGAGKASGNDSAVALGLVGR